MTRQEFLLHLSLIEGVGPGLIQIIIKQWFDKKDWRFMRQFSHADWRYHGFTEKQSEKLVAGLSDSVRFDQERALIERHNIQWTTLLDDNYPELLKHIHIPPAVLYWRGNLSQEKMIAVVGSRDTNNYGERMINAIVPELVAHNFTIVSGGALGADAMAHEQAIAAGCKTIIVLGSGLLKPMPYSNRRLFEKAIEQGGAMISSFPLQASAQPGNFPARNRIISGMSQGVLVVQAAIKSGARITAQYALEQGRDLFAIPGSIDDPLSAGCHALIKDGAKITVCAQDILEEYGIQSAEAEQKEIKKSESLVAKKVGLKDPFQQKIIDQCVLPQSIDDLAMHCSVDLAAMQSILFELQMNGIVEQDFTGLWKAKMRMT